MPPNLRDDSPSSVSNLPSDFYLNSVTNTRPATPANGLPQRPDLQVWQTYLKMGTQDKHWAKEVIQRTKKRDDLINS
jgi:hypothetical protein